MVTLVGMENAFLNMLGDLVALEYDAIAAYDSAISRLDDPGFRQQFQEYRSDHERHTRELSAIIGNLGGAPSTGAGAKSLLTMGKVVAADVFGDKAILQAMKSNEEDTNTAYERAVEHEGAQGSAGDILRRGLADERRHRAWIEQTLLRL